MRLNEWNIWEASPDPIPEDRPACRRWERAILLAVSGDLPPRPARTLDRHLNRCSDCLREYQLARRRREICLELALQRGKHLTDHQKGHWKGQSLWARIESAIGSPGDSNRPDPFIPSPQDRRESGRNESARGTHRGWAARLRRRSFVAASLLAAAWIAFHFSEGFSEGSRGFATPQGEERWAAQWNQFVSYVEPQGEFPRDFFSSDPKSSEFPVPEVIDF